MKGKERSGCENMAVSFPGDNKTDRIGSVFFVSGQAAMHVQRKISNIGSPVPMDLEQKMEFHWDVMLTHEGNISRIVWRI